VKAFTLAAPTIAILALVFDLNEVYSQVVTLWFASQQGVGT
jgi:hypothetical protein